MPHKGAKMALKGPSITAVNEIVGERLWMSMQYGAFCMVQERKARLKAEGRTAGER